MKNNSSTIMEQEEPCTVPAVTDVTVCKTQIVEYFCDNKLPLNYKSLSEIIRMLRVVGADVIDEHIVLVANKLI